MTSKPGRIDLWRRHLRHHVGWWCFTMAVMLTTAYSVPICAALDARVLTWMQHFWPIDAANEVSAIVFDDRSVDQLTNSHGWVDPLAAILRALQREQAQSVWLQLPPGLSRQDEAELRLAAGSVPLYLDQVAGTPPAYPLHWKLAPVADEAPARRGARVLLSDTGTGALLLPLAVGVEDGPWVISTAWKIARPTAPEPTAASTDLLTGPLAPSKTLNESLHPASLRSIVAPRLADPDVGVQQRDGMSVALGLEVAAAVPKGMKVVIGLDDPRARAVVPGLRTPLSEPLVWALVVDSLARGQLLSIVDPTLTMAATEALLLLCALSMALGSARQTLVSVAGGAILLAGLGIGAFVFANLVLPFGALALGVVMLHVGWAVDRLTRSANYFNRQMDVLRSELHVDAWVGRSDKSIDPIAIVEQAVAEIQSQRAFVLDLVDSLPIGVVAADRAGAVRLMNRRALMWMGLDADRSRTGTLSLQAALETLRCKGGSAADLVGYRDADREAYAAGNRAVWVQYRHIGGALPSVVAIADMSKLKAEATMKQEALDFLSHDLRAPFSSIAAIAQTPLVDRKTRTFSATLQQISRLAYRGLDLANEFLAVVRAERLDPASFAPVFLPELLEMLHDEFLPRARMEGVELEFEPCDEMIWLRGDAALLARALRNLIDNALRHAGRGNIRVSHRSVAAHVRVMVGDTGPGFTRDMLDPATAERDAGGSARGFGLGMPFVRRVAEMHDGELILGNRTGGGALVSLLLPRMNDGESILSAATDAAQATHRDASRKRGASPHQG